MTLAVLSLAAATTGCGLSSDRVKDCAAPANESALLDELARDPVLAVAPQGATRRAEPTRLEACHRIGEDTSRTSVYVEYDLPRDPGADEIRAVFEPVATKAGWTAMPAVPFDGLGGALNYCRDVLDQPIMLVVGWENAMRAGNMDIPAHLGVSIHGTATGSMTAEGRAAIEASRRAAGCRT